jgi:hypothetical protein
MGQLYWPETAGVARYSIPQHDDHYRASPKTSPRKIYQNSVDTNKQKCKLLEIVEDNEPSSKDIEHPHDGLTTLDEIRLDEMIETDLVSS